MRAGSHTHAWQLLQTWLTARGNAPDDYRWLCGRVAAWGDPRYVTRLTEDYVDRLLALKRNGEALDVVSARLTDDPPFAPSPRRPRCRSRASPPAGAERRGWRAPCSRIFRRALPVTRALQPRQRLRVIWGRNTPKAH
jgi:hypothetical protein